MPTALNLSGLRVAIYPNDHRPAHVHVLGAGREAVFVLNCPGGPVGLRENYRFTSRELRKIEAGLNDSIVTLCRAWETVDGAH